MSITNKQVLLVRVYARRHCSTSAEGINCVEKIAGIHGALSIMEMYQVVRMLLSASVGLTEKQAREKGTN
jgi:hypothetical protein